MLMYPLKAKVIECPMDCHIANCVGNSAVSLFLFLLQRFFFVILCSSALYSIFVWNVSGMYLLELVTALTLVVSLFSAKFYIFIYLF